MKNVVVASLTIGLLAVTPAAAQSTSTGTPSANNPSGQHAQPGAGGRSAAGQAGLPGNKSGPSAKQDDTNTSGGVGAGPAGSDNAKVPGAAGNKSGPATNATGQ